MRKLKNKLIDHPINPHRSRNQLQLCILRVRKHKVMRIKARQLLTADSTCQTRDVVDIWLSNHSRHRLLDIAVAKLVVRVLVPNLLEVEVGAVHDALEVRQVASVRDAFERVVEGIAEGRGEKRGGCGWVVMLSKDLGTGWLAIELPGQVDEGWDRRSGEAVFGSCVGVDRCGYYLWC